MLLAAALAMELAVSTRGGPMTDSSAVYSLLSSAVTLPTSSLCRWRCTPTLPRGRS